MKLYIISLALAFAFGYYMEYLPKVWQIALLIGIGGANMYAHGLIMKRYVSWMDRKAFEEKKEDGSKSSTSRNP